MRRLRALRQFQKCLGMYQGLKWYATSFLDSRGLTSGTVRMRPSMLAHPVELRLGSSDPNVFSGILVSNAYGFVHTLGGDIKTILDLGANIGLSSAFFLSRWPGAKLIAVEPDPENYALLRKNLSPYSAQCIQGAAWSRHTSLALSPTQGERQEWARIVLEGVGEVRAYTMQDLVLALGTVDFLKINIEGAEKAIFNGDTSWLGHVRNLAIELHDEECARAFRKGMNGYRWEESTYGGFVVCRSIVPRGPAAESK